MVPVLLYRHFAPALERLQQERVAAFREFKADVDSGGYPAEVHTISLDDDAFTAFVEAVES